MNIVNNFKEDKKPLKESLVHSVEKGIRNDLV